jgi:putative modified peptide
MEEGSKRTSHRPLNPALATQLLDLLIDDESFRDRFTQDFRGALVSIGYTDSDMDSLQCGEVSQLASREEFIKARYTLQEYLSSSAAMAMTLVFCFEAGKVGSLALR